MTTATNNNTSTNNTTTPPPEATPPPPATPLYAGAIQQAVTANAKPKEIATDDHLFTAPVTPGSKIQKLVTNKAPRLSDLNQFYADAPATSPTDAPSNTDADLSARHTDMLNSLQQTIDILKKAAADAAAETDPVSGEKINSNGSDAMIQLANLLSQLQVILTLVLAKTDSLQVKMNSSELSMNRANQAQIAAQIERIEAMRKKANIFSWIMTAIQVVAAVVMICTLNPASVVTGILMLTMTATQIAQQEGAMPESWTGSEWGDFGLKLGLTLAAAAASGGAAASRLGQVVGKAATAAVVAGALAGGGIMMGATNPIGAGVKAGGGDETDQLIADITNMIVSMIISIVGTAKIAGGAGSSKFIQGMMKAAILAELASAGFGIAKGVIQIKQSELQEELAPMTAASIILKTLASMGESDLQRNGSNSKQMNSDLSNLNQLVAQFMQPQAAATDALRA